jgi:glycosyltransferase involved in cell wall biosynthesis
MTSIVISAYNEEAVIGRCLDAFLADARPGEFDVTVVANGCTDATATVARSRPGVRVLEKPYGLKTDGLNAGDSVAVGYPRIYIDADVEVSADDLRTLVAALSTVEPSGRAPHAVVPRRVLDVRGRPLAVRAFYAINGRLPLYRTALVNHCVTALSEQGRSRFDQFPDIIADDLFLDSLFDESEKRQVDAATVLIATPRRTRGLVDRLARVRRGNGQLRSMASAVPAGSVRRAGRWGWLRDVVVPRPWLAPAGVLYVALILAAEVAARRQVRHGVTWGRDDSTRAAVT